MVLDAIILALPLPLLFKNGATKAARLRLTALISMGCM
jgi:hypothetical protein